MVAVASTKTTMKSSVITFEPRQVMLEKQTVKKQKEGKDNVVLLLKSIASYLHSKGFSNTLYAFQSEAPPEIDGWKTHSIDLEDIFRKYLETSEYPVEQNLRGSKDQDSQKEEDNLDAVQPVSKKKKKKSKGGEVDIKDGNGLPKHLGDEAFVDSDKKKSKGDFEKLVTETDNGNLLVPQHGKAKEKKKKQKLGSDSLTESFQQVEPEKSQDFQAERGCDDQSGKSHKKSKDKKNKNKSNSESCNLNTEQSKSGTLEEATEVIQSDDMHAKPKDKKKKKHKSVSMDSEHRDDSSLADSKEETSMPEENIAVDEKKGSKKRKRSGSEEGQPQAGGKTVRKESKITKTEGLVEKLQQKQLAKDGLDVENGDLDTGEKRKVETRDEGLKISQKPSPDEKIDGSMDVKERAGGLKNGQMEVNGHVDGLFRKEEREGIPTPKSKSKKSNDSAEPKTVNAFRRVKVEEVKFLDDRLQDNSYWAKDGSNIGYGAKAQEVLGQVKGRDFRHEKTKKKRGSYRGGQIDFQAHSVKFNYSDDDQ